MLKPLAALAAIAHATLALAGEEASSEPPAAAAEPVWTFSITAYPTQVRGGDNFTSGVAIAERGPLHLEARYNYEAVGARSAFVGWNFSGGETLTWKVTPMLGGGWGDIHAVIPAVEAAVAWRALDFYIEAEHVRDKNEHSDSYTYAWSELGLRPLEWLRFGIAGQRTRLYGGERDFQRGPFAQITVNQVTFGLFCFNPGAKNQILVGSLNFAF